MRYRQLDETGDMRFGNQQGDFLRDTPQTVEQAILTRLRLWVGEWFIDQVEGLPYQQAVLGMSKQQSIEPAIRERILGTQGVEEITKPIEFIFNTDTRKVTVLCSVKTIYGPLEITEVL